MEPVSFCSGKGRYSCGVPAPNSTQLIKNPTLTTTVNVMRVKANEAKKTLRPLAESICAKVEPGDYNSEIYAIYSWVRQNIRYAKDPYDVEYVQAPRRLLESKQGDCDDIATLLASLCMAMGHECRFMVVGFEDGNPSHVFCQVAVRGVASVDGGARGEKLWVTVDPVADENTAQMHSRVGYVQPFHL